MSTIFSIGEIAKIFNVSTQTLRLYDRINLLKPTYIKEESGYRYYSIDQFVTLEWIKRCKAMGFSLEEIKELISNDSSIEAMLEMTKKQKESISSKIAELKIMEEQLNILEIKIRNSISQPFNKVRMVENEERTFVKYKENVVTQEDVEMCSRDVILELEARYKILEHDITFEIPYEEAVKSGEAKWVARSVLVEIKQNEDMPGKNIIKVPKGQYLTMYFDDSTLDNRKYYNEMISYMKEHNIEPAGNFLETTMVLRVNKSRKENTLAKLEILCF